MSPATYLVSLLVAARLHSRVGVWYDSDAWCVLWSEDIIYLAYEHLVLSEDLPGEERDVPTLVEETNDHALAGM